jgi:hypothetical protein
MSRADVLGASRLGEMLDSILKLLILRRTGYRCQIYESKLMSINFAADYPLLCAKRGKTDVRYRWVKWVSCNSLKSSRVER